MSGHNEGKRTTSLHCLAYSTCNNKFLFTLGHVVFKNPAASTQAAPPPYGQVVNGNNSREFTGRTPPPEVIYIDALSHIE